MYLILHRNINSQLFITLIFQLQSNCLEERNIKNAEINNDQSHHQNPKIIAICHDKIIDFSLNPRKLSKMNEIEAKNVVKISILKKVCNNLTKINQLVFDQVAVDQRHISNICATVHQV